MVNKHFLTTSVLCAGILFCGADANLFGGGRGGAYSSGGYSGGASSNGSSGLGSSGFYGGRLFYGDYLTGGGYPGYFAPYAYPNSRPYSYADPLVPYSAPRISSFPSTAPAAFYYSVPLAATAATIHVVLPDPQASVLIDGQLTTSTGRERFYHTPQLKPGSSYQYKLRVTWMQDGHQTTQERTVAVTPGQTSEVVFTLMASDAVLPIPVVK